MLLAVQHRVMTHVESLEITIKKLHTSQLRASYHSIHDSLLSKNHLVILELTKRNTTNSMQTLSLSKHWIRLFAHVAATLKPKNEHDVLLSRVLFFYIDMKSKCHSLAQNSMRSFTQNTPL